MSELQLWSVPENMNGKLSQYRGQTVLELINRHHDVVVWCVKNRSWQLSADAKQLLDEKLKDCKRSFSQPSKRNRYSKHFNR